MAAATQSGQTQYEVCGAQHLRVQFSVMTSDQIESLSFNYGSIPATRPVRATRRIVTAPYSRSNLCMECQLSSANLATKTVPVRFFAEGGGDLTGAVVDVTLEFLAPGRQAVTPV